MKEVYFISILCLLVFFIGCNTTEEIGRGQVVSISILRICIPPDRAYIPNKDIIYYSIILSDGKLYKVRVKTVLSVKKDDNIIIYSYSKNFLLYNRIEILND